MANEARAPVLGVIEGFYGRPWSWVQRSRLVAFLGAAGFDLYLYAPKDDPEHRARWRDPHPASAIAGFRRLIADCGRAGIEFVYGLSPIDIDADEPTDLERAWDKLRAMHALGVRSFCLLFDDLLPEAAADVPRARAQARVAERLLRRLEALDRVGRMIVAPTEYHGRGDSAYLATLGAKLPAAIDVFWTGPRVCSTTIAPADLAAVTGRLRRRPLIWDNYPVNDGPMRHDPHLRPVRGRAADLPGAVAGILANGSLQPEASKITLHTLAAYWRAPRGYDPDAAWAAALEEVAGDEADAAAVRLLGRLASRSALEPWGAEPPVEDLEGAGSLAALRAAADRLSGAMTNRRLGRELAPWARKLRAWADAVEAVEDLARARREGRSGGDVDALGRRLGDRLRRVRRSPYRLADEMLAALAAGALGDRSAWRARPARGARGQSARDGEELLLGLDIGTGRCKAALVDPSGALVRVVRRPLDARTGADGEATYDPEALAAAAAAAIRECLSGEGRPVAAVGVASMAETGVPLDAAGRPLTEMIAWFDRRSVAEAARLEREVGAASLFAITGQRCDAKHVLPKLIWLRRHRPAVIERMAAWAGAAEYVALRLGGELATDPSLASRTLAFDVTARRWRPELLGYAGLDPGRMPSVRPAGAPAGRVTREAAGASGLPAGVPVTVAGHDHLVGALGAGAVGPGVAADSMGTAEVVSVALPGPRLDEAARRTGLSAGCHVVADRWYLLGGLPSAGGLLEWFAATVLGDGAGPERLAALLEPPAPGPSALVVRPFLRGRAAPAPDALARGSVVGLRSSHGRADLARAVVEGVSYHARAMLEAVIAVAGRPVESVRCYGGGERNRTWLSVKAHVNPWPTTEATPEAGAVGAALLAGVAAGIFASPGEAARRAGPGRPVAADPEIAAAYAAAYRERYLPSLEAPG